MTLFRMPKKGEYVRNEVNGRIDTCVADWVSWRTSSLADNYTLVSLEITVIEPPPPPKVEYYNVYDSGVVNMGYKSREAADRGTKEIGRTRIGCIKVTEGQFDD